MSHPHAFPYAPVTVVIPCYCCAATIARAVNSIARQTVLPQEILLIDDASPDEGRTLEQLQALRQRFLPLVSLRIIALADNRGPAGARNIGWDSATQPYVAFLDADDSWHPEKLRLQLQLMSDHPEVCMSGQSCVLYDEQTALGTPDRLRGTSVSAMSLVFRNRFSTPSVILKREIPLRFPEHRRHGEDLWLWQHMAFSGLALMRMDFPLTYVHKPAYGFGGLSADLWDMELGDLRNLAALRAGKKLSLPLFVTAVAFSLIKFVKRWGLTNIRRLIAGG